MPDYSRYALPNGLKVLLSENYSSPFAYVSLLYNAGSKHEQPEKTGIAHLFEHLMFSGTSDNPDFDEVLQTAGGENNAFTNADFTQYYNVVPVENISIALQLEADRMKGLILNNTILEKERKVILEEFYETCMNMPYGFAWHYLYGITFQKHSYQWPTIGKNVDHIKSIKLKDIHSFYRKFYRPGNAILSIVAPMNKAEVFKKVQDCFSPIKKEKAVIPALSQEPRQSKQRTLWVEEKVPHEALYIAFHIPERTHQDYRIADVLTDLLSGGRSSRFYQNLYSTTEVFAHIDAYVTGSIEPGLLIIEAKVNDPYQLKEAEDLIWDELKKIKEGMVDKNELHKFLNIGLSNLLFSETQGLNTAINLAFFEACGDAPLINNELKAYEQIQLNDVIAFARNYLTKDRSNILYITKKK
jgi:predicted Zn-dependent peptidase